MTNPHDLPRTRLTPTKQALLDRWLREGTGTSSASISRHNFEDEVRPLSFAQEQLSFLEQLHPQSAVYNIALAYRLDGCCDTAALERSFIEIARRHEALRTRLGSVDGRSVQLVAPEPDLAIGIIDLRTLPEDERLAQALRMCNEEANVPFDLARGPLLRVKLLCLAPQQHILLVVVHHVVFDGWSAGNLENELFELYDAFRNGRRPSLPALAIQYGDYAFWQRTYLGGDTLTSLLSYWKKQLEDAPPLLQLPADRPRPMLQTFKGACSKRLINQGLLEEIKAVGQSERATLFMTLFAAYSLLLSRYCRSRDVVIGTPIAGRTRAETEHSIGCFINTLALRVDLSGDPTFRELLCRVREVALGAYAHQDLPFEKLVEELKPQRSLAYSPLLQVMFALQNTVPLRVSGLEVERLELDRDASEFDLDLIAIAGPKGLALNAEYNTDLFDAATIGRLLAHFEMLLANIVQNPDEKIARLNFLSEVERRTVIHKWNETDVDHATDKTIVQLIEGRAALSPHKVAVEFWAPDGKKTRLSYRELNRRANKLAHRLIDLGVGPDIPVGICMERKPDMIVALLGVLKAGGAYVPLDPSYPSERIAFMLSDARLSVVVTERAQLSRLPPHNAKLFCLDRDMAASGPEHNLPARATANALAYVIYTSGSTGKPKGVMIEHGALVNLLYAMHGYTGITERDSLLAVTTLSFDIAALELYLPLISGAKLVLVGRDTAVDGEALSRCLSNRITLMQATPSTWRLLIESGWQGSHTLWALCGGEALTRELADQLLARCASLSNLYGPTETTIWSSAARVDANHPISIGRPLANTEMYIVDEAQNPVPIGVPGELHIGGAGLARGYLNRPELTAEKFIANPFKPHARLYKTGDLARYRADGAIEFLGRIDHQVKLRGHRIEPGEIEACLAQQANVAEAIVIAREDKPGDSRLVAYIVPGNGEQPPSSRELKEALRNLLPDYMLPSSFVLLDKLPLTPNGKLDRKALPAPDKLDAGASQVTPRTPLEAQLAAIFETVLQVDRVGVHDNFFDLGGHSFLVLRVLAEIEKALGRRLSVATLFQAPTVAEIAEVLTVGDSLQSSDVIVPLNAHGTTPPLFSVWMGIATELRELSRYLGPEQRMYGINSHWDPAKMHMTRIDEMATHYLMHVRKIQPHGPYYLSGDCVSSLIALEMAQQLVAHGEEVAALILIDPPAPNNRLESPAAASQLYRERIGSYRERIKRFLRSQRDASRAEQLALLSVRMLHALWGTIALPVCLALKLPLSRALLSRYIFDTHLGARDNYVPKPYAGRIWFIWASDDMDDEKRGQMRDAWSRLAPQATHYTVRGMHAELFDEPNVVSLADQVKRCLADAQAPDVSVSGIEIQRNIADIGLASYRLLKPSG